MFPPLGGERVRIAPGNLLNRKLSFVSVDSNEVKRLKIDKLPHAVLNNNSSKPE